MKSIGLFQEKLEQILGPDHGIVINLTLGSPRDEHFTWFALDADKFSDLVNKLDDFLNLLEDRGVPHVSPHTIEKTPSPHFMSSLVEDVK